MEWISVKDKQPKPGERVLCYGSYKQKIYLWNYDDTIDTVTHWMPLPELPKPELKSCPFCGKNGAKIKRDTEDDGRPWYAMCIHCFASTAKSWYNAESDAIALWNRRAGSEDA